MAEPCEGALDNVPTWQKLETGGFAGALDDLDCVLSRPGDGLAEFEARRAAIGEGMAHPRRALPYGFEG